MAEPRKVRKLREKLDKLLLKDKTEDALKVLNELSGLDPKRPRWPHRQGDLLRRAGRRDEAILAYERAVDAYVAEGFLARAVAMAKTIQHLDPSRTDVLERVDPSNAREVHRQARPQTMVESAQPDQAPAAAAEPSFLEAAAPLQPATDAHPDEVRFNDTSRVTEIHLSDLELDSDDEPAPSDEEAVEPSAARLALLPFFPLFAEAPRDALMAIAEGSELIEAEAGEALITVGDQADALYGLVEGKVRVHVPGMVEERVILLGEGEVFGESCLLEAEKRRASITAEERVTAFRIPREVLQRVVKSHPRVGSLLHEMLIRRLVANLLHTAPLFAGVDPTTRRALASLFEVRRAKAGVALAEAGKRCDGLYITLTGRCLVEPAPEGGSAIVGPGVVLGHGALLSSEASAYTATLQVDAVVLRLPATRFMAAVSAQPQLLETLANLSSSPTAQIGI